MIFVSCHILTDAVYNLAYKHLGEEAVDKVLWSTAAQIAKVPVSMAGEALEEALADILNPKIDAVANIIDGGNRDTAINWGQAGYDAAIGASLSALGQGGEAAINAARSSIDGTVANSADSATIDIGENDLSRYIGQPIVNTDNQSIREWYVANVSDISNQIDMRLPLEIQAHQAFDLRNQYKHEARVAMSDERTAMLLEKKRPVPTFEELLGRKMRVKGMTYEEALADILRTASTTNTNVNKEFGL